MLSLLLIVIVVIIIIIIIIIISSSSSRSIMITEAVSLSDDRCTRTFHRWNRNPRPQQEPKITSLDKYNINIFRLETPVYSISGVAVGSSYSIGDHGFDVSTIAILSTRRYHTF